MTGLPSGAADMAAWTSKTLATIAGSMMASGLPWQIRRPHCITAMESAKRAATLR